MRLMNTGLRDGDRSIIVIAIHRVNSMTGSERPSPEPFLKNEASPAVLGGENSGDALGFVGLGAFQPHSRGEFQDAL